MDNNFTVCSRTKRDERYIITNSPFGCACGQRPLSLWTLLRSRVQPKGLFVMRTRKFKNLGISQLNDCDKLDIVQAYNKTCCLCGVKFGKQTELVCHHREYGHGDNVFTLIALCQPCHQLLHDRGKQGKLTDRDMTFSNPGWAMFNNPYSPAQLRVIASYYQQLCEKLADDAVKMLLAADKYEQMEKDGVSISEIHKSLFGPSISQIKAAASKPSPAKTLTREEAGEFISNYLADIETVLRRIGKSEEEIQATVNTEKGKLERRLLP